MKTVSHYTTFLLLILLQLCCGLSQLFAQDARLSQGGQFKVDFVKGCVPFSVTIIEDDELDGFPESQTRAYRLLDQNRNEVMDWTNAKTIVISSPGTYYIEQQVQDRANDDIIQVRGISSDPVPVTMTNCGNLTAGIALIPEQNTFSEFRIQTRRLNPNTDEVSAFTVAPDQNGQFKGAISFGSTGEYEITIESLLTEPDPGATSAGCWDTTFSFTVYQELEAAIFTHLQAGISPEEDTILINHQLAKDVGYILEYAENGSGTFQPVQEISGQQTDPSSFLALDFQNNFYCFRAKTRNPCDENATQYSEPVCTAKLKANAATGGNQVLFETGTGSSLEEAVLLRKASDQTNWQPIHSFGPATQGSYLDSLIDCSTVFQYAIELVYAGGIRSLTTGLPVQNEAQRTLAAPVNILSTWSDASTALFLLPELISKQGVHLRAFRADEGSRLVDEADTGFISLPATGPSSCYGFQYTDACGNTSEISTPVCAIYLQNLSDEPDGLILQWNAYTGYADGVAYYELVKYDKDGNTLERTQLGTQTTEDLGTQELSETGRYYEVIAYPVDGTIPPSSSNRLLFEIEMKGYFPNAFIPGSEGENAIFTVKGKFVNQLQLQIFNRWGGKVFETNVIESGWDGTIKGSPAPVGTYMYRAVVGTADGQQQTYQGAVFLLRR